MTDAAFEGAWHSVTDADGETDLLLVVTRPRERVGILIENKVAAPQQDRQAERYHLRAARAQLAGRFDRYVACIVAPGGYLAGLPTQDGYDVRLDYEAIADWYAAIGDDPRARWRAAVMREAIAQGRRGYTMVVNDAVTRFHRDFWDHLQRHEPKLTMRRPTPKGSGSSWIRFKGIDFAPRREFALKLDQQIVELSFLGRRIEELGALQAAWPEDAVLRQKGRTAAVHLAVPPLDKMRPLAEQAEALAATLSAVHQLLPFAALLTQRQATG